MRATLGLGAPRRFWISAGAILVLALIVRAWLLAEVIALGLDIDELQSAVHALLPPRQLLASVRAFDPHPPLYYLQLHYWLAGGQSDGWIRTNSLLWGMLLVVSMLWVGTRLHGRRTGIVAGLLIALAPLAIHYAVTVRMYALLMLLAVWVYYFLHQLNKDLRPGFPTILHQFGLGVTLLAFLFAHGSGILIVPTVVIYGLLQMREHPQRVTVLIRWGSVLLLALLCYIPWLYAARTTELAHPRVPNFGDITQTLAQLLFGLKIVLWNHSLLWVSSWVVMGLLVVLGLANARSRALTATFVVTPLVTCALISYTLRPIWLTWTVAFTVPFIFLVAAILLTPPVQTATGAGDPPSPLRQLTLTAMLVLALGAALLYQQANYLPYSHLKQAVAYVQMHQQPGQAVLIPNPRIYWGWAWYMVGPGSANPLTTDYRLTTSTGVQLINQADADAQANIIAWIIYRDGEQAAVDAWLAAHPHPIQSTSFRNIQVVQILKE